MIMQLYIYSSFVQNAGKLSGCVTIVFLPVSFEGHNMFDHNLGSAITVRFKFNVNS